MRNSLLRDRDLPPILIHASDRKKFEERDSTPMFNDGASMLIEHVKWLAESEREFGPATAPITFGRIFTPLAENPTWVIPGGMKQCFANATVYALARDDVNYVEGFALDLDMPRPIQHAWIVDDRGQAIDPTWQENADQVYYGIPFNKSLVAEILKTAGLVVAC